MKRIEEVIGDIRYGYVLTIMKDNSLKEENSYNAYITEYDGTILIDVKEVELGNFLTQIPNIKSKLNSSNYYQVKYNFEKQVYQSAIINKVRYDKHKDPYVVENLITENTNLIDGIIDLDTKVANLKNEVTKRNLKKKLVS